jgi:hypothetical protein
MTKQNYNEKSTGNSWKDYIQWEGVNHTILPSNLKLGDEIVLGTLVGEYTFTVMSMTDTDATLESGDMCTVIVRNENGEWQYNHWTKDKNSKHILPIIYRKEVK